MAWMIASVFEDGGRIRYLLHPRDETTGVENATSPSICASG
jgi:hypothetical protein